MTKLVNPSMNKKTVIMTHTIIIHNIHRTALATACATCNITFEQGCGILLFTHKWQYPYLHANIKITPGMYSLRPGITIVTALIAKLELKKREDSLPGRATAEQLRQRQTSKLG